ncbi:MAG: hypothetical protein LQ345_001225 [Seirophora villosa]|nr:MAG: hypothetical protein LQ345_001225 [Seirophora villosa]
MSDCGIRGPIGVPERSSSAGSSARHQSHNPRHRPAGATNLQKLTTDRETLRQLQIVYAKALVNTLWLPIAAASAATIWACGMEWKKVTAKEIRGVLERQIRTSEQELFGLGAGVACLLL